MPQKLNLYAASFPSGAQEIIKVQLKKKSQEKIKIEQVLDGLVFFRTSYQPFELRQMRYLANIFYIINEEWRDVKIEVLAKDLIRTGFTNEDQIKLLTKNKHTFRIIAARENSMIPFDRGLLLNLEARITRLTGLKVNIKLPDVEFWLTERSEGLSYFALRVSSLSRENKFKKQGELRREVAQLLCLESHPAAEDVVLDPFCGSGAVVRERATSFPYEKILAYDTDVNAVKNTKEALRGKKKVEISQVDFFKSQLPDSSINKIITDPPWGVYRETADLEIFYQKLIKETDRLLIGGGLAVFLVGGDRAKFEEAIQKSELSLEGQTNILVSGKKASIYKCQKK